MEADTLFLRRLKRDCKGGGGLASEHIKRAYFSSIGNDVVVIRSNLNRLGGSSTLLRVQRRHLRGCGLSIPFANGASAGPKGIFPG